MNRRGRRAKRADEMDKESLLLGCGWIVRADGKWTHPALAFPWSLSEAHRLETEDADWLASMKARAEVAK